MEFDEYFSAENVIRVFNSIIKNSNNVGVDGTNAKKFEGDLNRQVDIIVRKCRGGTYRFTRFKEKLIPKDARRAPRQISIPTIRDAIVLRILCDFLTEKFPKRRPKLPHLYIKDIQKILKKPDAGDTFLRLDVKEFYPSIDQAILKKKLELGKITNTAVNLIITAVTNQTGNKSSPSMSRGIPQGLSISNILASIYFSEIDGHLKLRSGECYFRYVDDILFICSATESKALYNYTKKLLRSELKLSIHKPNALNINKSTIRSTYKGVDYLGFYITDQHLKVRDTSYKKVFDSIVNLLTLYVRNYENYPIGFERECFRDRILWRLNLRITGCRFDNKSVGWMFFFRQTKDMQQINGLDAFVTKILRKRKLSAYRPQVKKFIKTYYEILYNRDRTRYIPDFDNDSENFTRAEKIAKIVMLDGESEDNLKRLTDGEINQKFRDTMRREVRRMEQEMVDLTKGYY